MTVRELIAKLQMMGQSEIVILSKDAEGNSYLPLKDVIAGSYLAEPMRVVMDGPIEGVSAVVLYPDHWRA